MNFPFKNKEEFRDFCLKLNCSECIYNKDCDGHGSWEEVFKKLHDKYSLKAKLKKLLS